MFTLLLPSALLSGEKRALNQSTLLHNIFESGNKKWKQFHFVTHDSSAHKILVIVTSFPDSLMWSNGSPPRQATLTKRNK